MPDSIKQYLAELNRPDFMRQAAAAEALAALGEAAQPALVALIQASGSQDEAVRNWCTAALEEVGPPDKQQIEDLSLLAKSAHSDVAFWAVTLLGRARDQAAQAVLVLTERLKDSSSPQVQQRAAWALGRIGRGAEPALEALRAATRGPDMPLSNQAQRALERIQAAR